MAKRVPCHVLQFPCEEARRSSTRPPPAVQLLSQCFPPPAEASIVIDRSPRDFQNPQGNRLLDGGGGGGRGALRLLRRETIALGALLLSRLWRHRRRRLVCLQRLRTAEAPGRGASRSQGAPTVLKGPMRCANNRATRLVLTCPPTARLPARSATAPTLSATLAPASSRATVFPSWCPLLAG